MKAVKNMIRLKYNHVLLLLFYCLFSGGHSEENPSENPSGKRGHCPIVPSGNNVTLAACATSCPGGSNCSNIECSSDTNCTGIEKCCNTGFGMKCVYPEYKSTCVEDIDCAGILICCKGHCVLPKPPKKWLIGKINKSKCD
ncbi:waprin-Phi1 [Xenopus laevis]|uniref:Waprin-Phi1 n=1 Tax=Xenopus laevis TaxID=8355 RepID=A0A8J1L8R3_XENLA|nr:waprin-Phi1 [Xenopus laevis]